MRGHVSRSSAAARRTCRCEERSARTRRAVPPAASTCARAASPRSRERTTRTTSAPSRPSPTAAALPIPALPPVTTHVLPRIRPPPSGVPAAVRPGRLGVHPVAAVPLRVEALQERLHEAVAPLGHAAGGVGVHPLAQQEQLLVEVVHR